MHADQFYADYSLCWFPCTQAQDKKQPTVDIRNALSNNGHKLAVAVLEVADVLKHASNSKARYTFLL